MTTTTSSASPDPNDRNKRQIEALIKLAKEHGLLPETDEDRTRSLNSQRPQTKLPGDYREVSQFAREIGQIVNGRGLFRRDQTPVIVNAEKKRLDVMTPEMFRTWVEHYLVCYREKRIGFGEDQRTLISPRTMNVDVARATLESRSATTAGQQTGRFAGAVRR